MLRKESLKLLNKLKQDGEVSNVNFDKLTKFINRYIMETEPVPVPDDAKKLEKDKYAKKTDAIYFLMALIPSSKNANKIYVDINISTYYKKSFRYKMENGEYRFVKDLPFIKN